MAFPHRLDPPVQWAAAATCGKLIAQGILEVDEVVPDLYRAAIRAGYNGDRRGLRTRLFGHVRDNAEHWRMQRDRTEWLIRQKVAPLVDARETAEAILAAAYRLNEDHGEPFVRREVYGLAAEILQAALLRLTRGAGRRRHAR